MLSGDHTQPPITPEILARTAMTQHLAQQGRIPSPAVLQAFLVVPRHLFLPEIPLDRAYADEAVVTKWNTARQPLSSASQPAIIAIMLEQLAVQRGMRVLEIGAGTGYNAALLAEIVGPTGHVTTIDIDDEIAREAQTHLWAAGYGPERVSVVTGDGALGWAANAPYDRIILTAGAWDVAPAWMAQLVNGGRLVLPLAVHTAQYSVALDRLGETLRSVSLRPCGFIRLRGPFAGPEAIVPLGATTGLKLLVEPPLPQIDALTALLATPPRTKAIDITHTEWLRCALAFTEAGVVTLLAAPAHPLLGQTAIGIVTAEGDAAAFLGIEVTGGRAAAMQVEYGAATAGLHLERVVQLWRDLGQPTLHDWQMLLVPPDAPTLPDAIGQTGRRFILHKQHWRVELWVEA
jgi:protein-L-isoaspartate(D-aspartate) O-methyltransferase